MSTGKEFQLKITNDEKSSSVEMVGTIPASFIEKHKEVVVEQIVSKKKVDGFRDGKAPKELIQKDLNSLEIWQESAKEVFMKNFPEILFEEGFAPLGTPSMAFTKIADGGDVDFKVNFIVMPKIFLPDIKELVKGLPKATPPSDVTEEDISSVITDLKKAQFKTKNKGKELPKDEDLPNLEDSFIQEITTEYKNFATLKEGVVKQIKNEKELQAKSNHRKFIVDRLIEKANVNIPDVVLDADTQRGLEDVENQAKKLGTTIDKYLESRKITLEELKKEIRDNSKKRAVVQIALNSLATKLNILPDNDIVEKEVERLKSKAGMNEKDLRIYLATMLINEKVINKLEEEINNS